MPVYNSQDKHMTGCAISMAVANPCVLLTSLQYNIIFIFTVVILAIPQTLIWAIFWHNVGGLLGVKHFHFARDFALSLVDEVMLC